MTKFSKQENIRYGRHILLDEIGIVGQQKLKAAKVLVIGAGGLGCPALQYLTASGVGKIGLIDDDTVSESNLHRQILYTSEDIGKHKTTVAKEKLLKQNPLIEITTYTVRLSKENALEIFNLYDIILDGSDNFPTRYLVNDAAVMAKKPIVFGSIFKFSGQVSVLNYKGGPTYRCLFPTPPAKGEVPNCSEVGVLGVLPGIIGSIQANEALKIILEIGAPLSGKLMLIDTLTMQTNVLNFNAKPENLEIASFVDYETFCGVEEEQYEDSISPSELNSWLKNNKEVQLVDVREAFEIDICSIGGKHIPLNEIPVRFEEINKNIPVVVICHHGQRSLSAINYLKEKEGYSNLINLNGGVHQWAVDVGGIDTY